MTTEASRNESMDRNESKNTEEYKVWKISREDAEGFLVNAMIAAVHQKADMDDDATLLNIMTTLKPEYYLRLNNPEYYAVALSDPTVVGHCGLIALYANEEEAKQLATKLSKDQDRLRKAAKAANRTPF
jgi:hypothetical protein